MKRKNLFPAILLCGAVMLSAATACSSDDPEIIPEPEPEPTPAPAPEPEPEPTPEGQYGVDETAAKSYFESRIKDTEGSYETAGALTAENIAVASDYVWNLWKQAVDTYDTQKLPNPDKTEGFWDQVVTQNVNWTIGSRQMSAYYGVRGAKPAKGYPFVINLHGSGEDAALSFSDMLYFLDLYDVPTKGAAAYFVPQSPDGGTGCRWFTPSRQLYWERAIRQAFLDSDIDPNKVIITGLSEGAYGTQRLASFYADYLSAVAPASGGDQLFNCPPENFANVYYYHVNGSEDTMYGRLILTNKVGEELDRLSKAHKGYYAHKIRIINGGGHCDWTADNVPVPEVVKYERNATPKYFYWENYGMGGQLNEGYRYRKGFYNLEVLESEAGTADNMKRDCYEMTIGDNNVIDLNINVVTVTATEMVNNEYWSMNTGVSKSFAPATKGKVRIYLSSKLVDLTKPVVVKVNGVEKFNGTVTPDSRWLVESCGLFFDPERLFPAAVEVAL